jgi:DNA polymerase III subunit delta
MPAVTELLFNKALKARAFEPVYYLFGDDDYLKADAVRRLVDAAVNPSTRDFNLETRRGNELDAGTLGSLLNTPPMMAERRAVVVRDVTALKKDARAELERYLKRPSADTMVVLVATAGAKADRLLSDSAAAIEFAPLSGDRVPKWIMHHAKSVLGVEITPEAALLLQAAIGGDLPALAAELDKLASFALGRAIDEAAVTEIVGIRRGETQGDLLDRIGMRDAGGALALVEHVLSQPKTTAVSVVMALTTQTLALAWGRAMRDQGMPAGRLSGELMSLLKGGGGFPGRPWGEATTAWAQAVDRWTAAELDDALDLLLEADAALKETRLSTDEQLLSTLVLSLCVRGPSSGKREGGSETATATATKKL